MKLTNIVGAALMGGVCALLVWFTGGPGWAIVQSYMVVYTVAYMHLSDQS